MLSVIVPVVWCYEPFCDFLATIVELPVVGEVILINNNTKKTPEHSVLSHPKVKLIDFYKNIYVNPAWNLGVEMAENNNICIMNDDINVDLRVFFEADKFLSQDTEKIGMLCIGTNHHVFRMHNKHFEYLQNVDYNDLIINGDIKIVQKEQSNGNFGYGTLFFIDKRNWIDIPRELKINWGDKWQLDCQAILGRTNYYINNCFYYSPWNMAAKNGIGFGEQEPPTFKICETPEYFKQLKIDFRRAIGIEITDEILNEDPYVW